MEIKHIGSQPSGKGPEAYFTGAVRVDPLFSGGGSGARRRRQRHLRARCAHRVAHASARPDVDRYGGLRRGRKREGESIKEIRAGDIVWFPPGEKHWHGAAPATAMTHIAIQEAQDGKTVDWMEKVSDAQYGKPSGAQADRGRINLTPSGASSSLRRGGHARADTNP